MTYLSGINSFVIKNKDSFAKQNITKYIIGECLTSDYTAEYFIENSTENGFVLVKEEDYDLSINSRQFHSRKC